MAWDVVESYSDVVEEVTEGVEDAGGGGAAKAQSELKKNHVVDDETEKAVVRRVARYVSVCIGDVNAGDKEAALAFQDGFGDAVDVGKVDGEVRFCNAVIHGVAGGGQLRCSIRRFLFE